MCTYTYMSVCVSPKLFKWLQTIETFKPNMERGPMTGTCEFICWLLLLSCCSTNLNTFNWNCMIHKVYKIFLIWPGGSDSKEYAWNVGAYQGFPGGSAGKESAYNVRDLGSIPGLGRSLGQGKGCSLQYSDLDSPWGHKESDSTENISLHLEMWETQLWSLGEENPLQKNIATSSNIFAWRIPRREEPGELQSMGSQRVGLDWTTDNLQEKFA